MTNKQDNYSAFNELNLSNARSEGESYEDYKKRLKQNGAILKLYNTVGRDNFKEGDILTVVDFDSHKPEVTNLKLKYL